MSATEPTHIDTKRPGAKPAGSNGNGGNYGERLAVLEEKVKHVASRTELAEIKGLLGRIDEKLNHVPTKAAILMWILGAIPALVLITLSVVRVFFNLSPP